MRKALIILVLLLGLVIGYLAGCRSHTQARASRPDPQPGQAWHARDGSIRIVRAVVHEGDRSLVWWHRSDSIGADRHCTVQTWRQWARKTGAEP